MSLSSDRINHADSFGRDLAAKFYRPQYRPISIYCQCGTFIGVRSIEVGTEPEDALCKACQRARRL